VIWRCRDVTFDLTDRVLVMGILNVTPDSFSDGGRYLEPSAAIARGVELLEEGADMLDLGAESTRPGSLARAGRRAVAPAGARSTGFAKRARGGAVARHARGRPWRNAGWRWGHRPSMTSARSAIPRWPPSWRAPARIGAHAHARHAGEHAAGHDLWGRRSPKWPCILQTARSRAARAGVAEECIAFDPGIGFGKSAAGSLELLARLPNCARSDGPSWWGIAQELPRPTHRRRRPAHRAHPRQPRRRPPSPPTRAPPSSASTMSPPPCASRSWRWPHVARAGPRTHLLTLSEHDSRPFALAPRCRRHPDRRRPVLPAAVAGQGHAVRADVRRGCS
jgi:dihydropteroate synthase